MAYLALYRRFRPSGFNSLIGQDHIVRTLVNQINSGRIGHAYLFCGARGTGKTSAAKIFAKAINCLYPINGSPCGKCEVCKSLAEPSNLDILEMDAASNNKVENVREIRDKIQYPPVSGKYKVYIIDEVHMLTTEAFNALLKTLEEPPKHAVFILATTEVHKLPSTILSRCMRFDFRLISTRQIANLIASIYDEIGKEYESEAITAIAKSGAGSVRDALSIADICVSYRDGKLLYSDVLDVLGATDTAKITKLCECIFTSETGQILASVEELYESGKSVGVLCRDIISRLREIIIAKTCTDGKSILDIPEDVYSTLKRLGESVDEHRLLRIIEIFSEADTSLRYSVAPKVVLESACIKASMPQNDYNIDALLSRISSLEKTIKEGNFASQPSSKKEEIKKEVERVEEITTKVIETPVEGDKPIISSENPQQNKVEETKEQVDFGQDNFVVEDYGVPEAPPEDFGMIEVPPMDGFFSSNSGSSNRQMQSQNANTGTDSNIATPKPAPMSAGKIWGTVIRKLRSDGNIMLWVACQEMKAKLDGKVLKIIATDESGYKAITKDESLKILSATVRSVGDYETEVVPYSGEEEDTFGSEVEKVRRTFGGKITIKD